MNYYALSRFIRACLYFYFLKSEVGLMDRGPDFQLYCKVYTSFLSGKGI